MKLLYTLPILLGLCACNEKPIYTTNNLACKYTDEKTITTVPTKVDFYKDYAIVYEGVGPSTIKTEMRLSEISSSNEGRSMNNIYGANRLIVFADIDKNIIYITTKHGNIKYDCYFEEGDSHSKLIEINRQSIEKIFHKTLN